MSESLTPKQKMFCQEYLIDLNATQAAIRAGYSKETAKEIGYENLTKPHVSDFLQSLMNERSERVQIDADYVLGNIKKIGERCMQEVRPLLDKKGNHVKIENENGDLVPAYVFDSSGALKANELLGKHLKLFTDKVEHSGGIQIVELDKDDLALGGDPDAVSKNA